MRRAFELRTVWLALAVAVACTASAHDPDASAAGALAVWTLSPEPVLHIGDDAVPATTFDRIQGLTRLSTGEIVVADGGSSELRVFAPSGAHVRTLSRRGSGPGELEGIAWMQRVRDTIFALDFQTGALSYFTADSGYRGRVARTGSGALTAPRAVARLAGGALLIGPGFKALMTPPAGLTRDTVRLGVMDPAAADTIVWLGSFPGAMFLGYRAPEIPGGATLTTFTYGPRSVYGVSGDRIWIGDSGEREIALYDATGARVGTATWPDTARPLDAAAMERVRERELAATTSPVRRRGIEAVHDPALRPSRAPYFASFVAGPDGEMWVERFREDTTARSEFVVFDGAGTPRATVTIPAHVRLREAGADHVLGVLTDDDGVQTVVQYALRRAGGGD